MEIYSLACDHHRMFNSRTNEIIVDEECDDNAKSLIAYWLDDFSHFNDETLKAAWEAYEENINKGNINIYFNWKALHKFIKAYDAPDWVAYKITSGGYASYTVLYVVDKDVDVEEIIENRLDNADSDNSI